MSDQIFEFSVVYLLPMLPALLFGVVAYRISRSNPDEAYLSGNLGVISIRLAGPPAVYAGFTILALKIFQGVGGCQAIEVRMDFVTSNGDPATEFLAQYHNPRLDLLNSEGGGQNLSFAGFEPNIKAARLVRADCVDQDLFGLGFKPRLTPSNAQIAEFPKEVVLKNPLLVTISVIDPSQGNNPFDEGIKPDASGWVQELAMIGKRYSPLPVQESATELKKEIWGIWVLTNAGEKPTSQVTFTGNAFSGKTRTVDLSVVRIDREKFLAEAFELSDLESFLKRDTADALYELSEIYDFLLDYGPKLGLLRRVYSESGEVLLDGSFENGAVAFRNDLEYRVTDIPGGVQPNQTIAIISRQVLQVENDEVIGAKAGSIGHLLQYPAKLSILAVSVEALDGVIFRKETLNTIVKPGGSVASAIAGRPETKMTSSNAISFFRILDAESKIELHWVFGAD